jgi:hypothetical protein
MTTTTNSSFVYLRETLVQPGARDYLLFAVACLAVNTFVLIGMGYDAVAFLTAFLAVPGLIARWTIAPYLYLIAMGYQLFDPGFDSLRVGMGSVLRRGMFDNRLTTPRAEQIMLIFGTLGYIVCQFRLLAIWVYLIPPRLKARRGQTLPFSGPLPRRPVDVPGPEPARLFFHIPIVFSVGFLVFWLSVKMAERASRRGTPLDTNWLYLISACGLIAVIFGLGQVLAQLFLRRRPSAVAARLELADLLWQETHREQDRFQNWRLHRREKQHPRPEES